MSAHLVTTKTNEDGSTTFKTIEPTLSQQEQIEKLKKGFEQAFGKDQETRNTIQWRNLVARYGIEFVEKTENMTKDQIMTKMAYWPMKKV